MTDTGNTEDRRKDALDYHRKPSPGKLALSATKQLSNQNDLSLAYSPGVAAPCEEIEKSPDEVFRYTTKGNLVAVITNGTAVLGLGNIGPLAAKPVMEGKAVLFKKFAGIDAFDLEINESDPDKLCDIIASLEPTFGAVNLEDIKAPECFYIERKLRERMNIPIFHDDQHGTAIITGAALINALLIAKKNIADIKLVVSGAGAAAIACLDLLIVLGLKKENIWVCDSKGVIHSEREASLSDDKKRFMQKTSLRTLEEAIVDADVFLGVSSGGLLTPAMVKTMASTPIIFALANPYPEITPQDAKKVCPDAIIATGRSDYPNQVNNVLCFPFIFRGALDCGATTINQEMEVAAVHAIARLAHLESTAELLASYGVLSLSFGPDYLIPKPFDPRLMTEIPPAVAKAAAESGVAKRPIKDFAHYHSQLLQRSYHSGTFMKPIFDMAKRSPKRIVFAEGEDERSLRAAQIAVDEGIVHPILIGRPSVLEKRIARYNLRLKLGGDVQVVNPEEDERYRDYVNTYYEMNKRRGVTLDRAKIQMRQRLTLIASMLVHKGDADGMVCGLVGMPHDHLRYIDSVLGKAPQCSTYAAMNVLILENRNLAIVDTHINENPNAEQIAEITLLAAKEMQRLGMKPHVALLSHSNFGSSDVASAQKMRRALEIIQSHNPDFEVDGEMHGDIALDEELRQRMMPDSMLRGDANLLVMPNLDAANIAYNLLKTAAGQNVAIGPILLGCNKPAHILTSSAPVRRVLNMATLSVVDAIRAKN